MSELAVAATQSQAPIAPPPAPPAEVATPSDQNPAVEAPATPEKAEVTDAQPEKHGQSRFERRISKLYRKLGESDARAAALQKELETMKAPKPSAQADGVPRLEQFDDIEKYAEAKADWAKSQAIKDYESKQRTTAQQREQQQLVTSWEEKVEAASEKYDDFDEQYGNMKPNSTLTAAIMREENGADIAYYLGKTPKEFTRIASLDPMGQVLAIGRLAAKLASEPPVAKQPSKAPPPIAPVSGKAAAPSEELSADDDMRTHIRKMNRILGRKTAK